MNHHETSCDVLIMGGGLSGLTLAIQLKQNLGNLRIVVVEKAQFPVPEAAHKVGESSVEIGSGYFQDRLGLKPLLENELPKLGLRFFYTHAGNHDLASRVELGPSDFLFVKSYQIDRGRFENALVQKCLELGVEFREGARVTEMELGECDHRITVRCGNADQRFRTQWLVDASGRRSLLKQKLGLAKPTQHDANAAWFRIGREINIDDWASDPDWRGRNQHTRRISTNHLMGKGYWVWLIPLASGSTSIGIVADAKLHPYSTINTFAKAQAWLRQYEPQCARVVEDHLEDFQDFLALKHYSHSSRQIYSENGWCLTGDAGLFLDPLYSPGSDFIGMSNTCITDLITRHFSGEAVATRVREYERIIRTIFQGFLLIYENQYPVMGSAKAMSFKIVWDFVMYWGGIALIFFAGKLCDLEFMQAARVHLNQFFVLNLQMQQRLLEWSEQEGDREAQTGGFLDYSKLEFLRNLNKDLLRKKTESELLEQLSLNATLAQEIHAEMLWLLQQDQPDLMDAQTLHPPQTTHVQPFFAPLFP
ncbi:MAG: NAD(P)/FAD-dependent oxidoreductase [SAR324 cluster bacterium]|nr:NAD(P)/FAD-dependent oxidoreductase [SAR324 cluster bacterium]